MIRRDYILQMIQEFIQAMARINSLKQGQHWNQASEALDAEFQRLVGSGAEAIVRLSETELLARIVQDGPTQGVREKTLIVVTLLKEAGDAAAAQDRSTESRAYYLKALHLLLDTLARGEAFECPEFVPKVELLREALRETPLPASTCAMLMQHFERTGQLAKAEDALHDLLDAEPDNPRALEFGITFYQRLSRENDEALAEGNLSRIEVKEGWAELERRQTSVAGRANKSS